MWDQWIAMFMEKSDNVWHISYFDLTVRMILAVLLGGIIGLEREWSNHAAGLRTHIMVCVGSASIMLLSIYGFSEFVNELNVRVDPARLAAQVISGIGFLGAGAILRNGLTISGLTTASSIWVVAAIGLCVGAGFYYVSILVTILVFLVLQVLNRWEKKMKRTRTDNEMTVLVRNQPGILGKIAAELGEHGILITNVRMSPRGRKRDNDENELTQFVFRVRNGKMIEAIDRISAMPGVESIVMSSQQDIKPPNPGGKNQTLEG
jgi:Uncharacterized membrane protein